MRKKTVILILIAVMVAAGAVLLAVSEIRSGKPGNNGAGLKAEDLAAIEKRVLPLDEFEKKRKTAGGKEGSLVFSADDVRWQKGEAAFDAESRTVFLPCTASEGLTWQEILSGLTPADKGACILYAEDAAMEDISSAIAEGSPFRALLTSEEGAAEFNVVLTGLPVLSIHKLDSAKIERKEEHSGRISLISRLGAEEERGAQEINCSFHVRGNVSSFSSKKPYKISLLDINGNKLKTGFLDLREDDDWILNPLYSDETLVREATAYELWDKTAALSDSPMATSRIRYVEFFMDDSLQGIYGLMEPIDRKQLMLSEGDILYKIDKWDREYPYIDLYEEKEKERATEILTDKGYSCVEIRYPLAWDSTASWKPMQVFHEFCFRNGNSKTLSEAGLHVDTGNLTDLSLFCAMTHAMDNNWKNTFLVCRRRSGTEYDLYRTIWDLNYVFGDVFVFKPEKNYTYFDIFTADVYEPEEDSTYDFESFLKEDPSLWDALCKKWKKWRESGISADFVCEMAESNFRTLRSSGALARDMKKWPHENSPAKALEKMEEWIVRRFEFLDNYLD